jgi:hypothetical protein
VRISSRTVFAGVISLAILPACLFASSTVAQASPARPARPCGECSKIGNFTRKYDHSWTFVSHELNVCAVFNATGKITYALWLVGQYKESYYLWSGQTLKNPTLSLHVDVYNPHSKRCGGKKSATKVRIGQHWSGYSCSFNPTISAAYPWGVAVSGWPSCSNRSQAEYTTSYGKGSAYHQYNSGSPASFGNYSGMPAEFDYPCYGVFASGVLWEGNTSDSYAAADVHHTGSVCLKNR